jgi:uncharacterized membrane protein YeiH
VAHDLSVTPEAIPAAFELPGFFNVGATFIWAMTGSAMGARRGYDITGMFVMAFVSALGGGLLRDGIFLQDGPPLAVRTPLYLVIVVAGALAGGAIVVAIRGRRTPLEQAISDTVDALGLGAYACVGAQMALQIGLPVPSAIFIGVINGCGGGLLRDVLINRIWMLPGQLLALVALLGSLVFVTLVKLTPLGATESAWIAIAVTFVVRVLAIVLNWRTTALLPPSAIDAD